MTTTEPAAPSGAAGFVVPGQPASGQPASGQVGAGPAGSLSNAAGRSAAVSVRRIFSTRAGGVSPQPWDSLNLGGGVGDDPDRVRTNRSRFAASAGLTADRVVWMRQVHGTTVLRVDGPESLRNNDSPVGDTAAEIAEADGVLTTTPGVGLAVLVADCIPILAADPVAGVIAAVHAGRRGAAGGIALRALDAMVLAGATPERIDVWLGPAICGDCYEVPTDLRDEVEADLPGSAATTGWGSPGLDLRAGVARQLSAAGVGAVRVDSRCTRMDFELFSHRRGAPTGRLAGLIWMPHRP